MPKFHQRFAVLPHRKRDADLPSSVLRNHNGRFSKTRHPAQRDYSTNNEARLLRYSEWTDAALTLSCSRGPTPSELTYLTDLKHSSKKTKTLSRRFRGE